MPLIGSDGGFQADNRGGLIDELGNTIISASASFGASPLGVAARTQALYGIPNANFNITPPDPSAPIVPNQNDLPYWSLDDSSGGIITATTTFDATAQTWGVTIDPGTAASGVSLTLSTRSYLITDDNLALRQKAILALEKSGTAAATTQWNVKLNATYYDNDGDAVDIHTIGTVYDTEAFTSINGLTTSLGVPVSASAAYLDLNVTLTTTANITGSAKAILKSLLLTNRSSINPREGRVYKYFFSSESWIVPAEVYAIDIAAIGAGGGGGGGQLTAVFGTANAPGTANGGGGGGAGGFAYVPNAGVDPGGTVVVAVGAGGVGGTARIYQKIAGIDFVDQNLSQSIGGVGGATSVVFAQGTALLCGGGGAGSASAGIPPAPNAYSPAGITATGGTGAVNALSLSASPASTNRILPFFGTAFITIGIPGGDAVNFGAGTPALGLGGSVYVDQGYSTGGAFGGSASTGTASSYTAAVAQNGGAGRYGNCGAGGGAALRINSGTADYSVYAGYGEPYNAIDQAIGCGGAGGGGLRLNRGGLSSAERSNSTLDFGTGEGGVGADGVVVISYITPGDEV